MAEAYYNEHDPYAAQWLRNLISAGHVAPGVVDERDIRDVEPTELLGFSQYHFFAGIGVWSHALRRAGWPDDRPIWTGSCPCQPFSAAGMRGGAADERHLWPEFHRLIAECRPPVVVGEQVASKDGLGWLDLVQADLETSGYAVGASDLCAAGFGGAHIRQRLYFVGLADAAHGDGGSGERAAEEGTWPNQERRGRPSGGGDHCGLADSEREGLQGRGGSERGEHDPLGQADALRSTVGLADANGGNASAERQQRGGRHGRESENGGAVRSEDCGSRPEPDGDWPLAPLLGRNAADWLLCRDGKWRPVEPDTFPLAHAAPARVGRLRAYGNALDAETATEFVGAVAEVIRG